MFETVCAPGAPCARCVHGHRRFFLLQLKTERAQHGEDRGEIVEAPAGRDSRRRRRQPHGFPALGLDREQTAQPRAVTTGRSVQFSM